MYLYLDIPIPVEIVYGCDASSISIRIVHVFHVMRTVTRITSHHRLENNAIAALRFIEEKLGVSLSVALLNMDLNGSALSNNHPDLAEY